MAWLGQGDLMERSENPPKWLDLGSSIPFKQGVTNCEAVTKQKKKGFEPREVNLGKVTRKYMGKTKER